jgi:hypothetical protein
MNAEYFTVRCQSIGSMTRFAPERASRSRHIVQCRDIVSLPFCPISSLCLLSRLARGGCGRTLSAEELAGDVQGLAAHNDNLLAVEQLLGDGAGEATEEVPFAVDDLSYKSARTSVRY